MPFVDRMRGPARSLGLLLLLSGCLVDTALYADARARFTDDDADGHSEQDGDCDDADPGVHPGAQETCDGRDEDCDGRRDEDPVDAFWYADTDADGRGDPAQPTPSCSPVSGAAPNADDCDDTRPDVHADATERCDSVDNDCDGEVDEASASDATDWYADADGDGIGAGEPLASCDAPPGGPWATVAGDCDDADAAVHPGAAERCNGEDDDCDGLTDDPPVSDGAAVYRDADGDGFGDPEDGACTPQPGFVANADDCDDSRADVRPGEASVCNDGVDNDCDSDPTDCPWPAERSLAAAWIIHPHPDAWSFGDNFLIGDLDGNGVDEAWVTAGGGQAVDDPSFRTGTLSALDLPLRDGDQTSLSRTIQGQDRWSAFGVGAAICDWDGDGYDDLFAGAYLTDLPGERDNGAVYYFPGPVTAASAAGASVAILGDDLEELGRYLSAGCTSGPDNWFAVATSAMQASSGAMAGAGNIRIFGPTFLTATVSTQALATVEGSFASANLGNEHVAADFNGDGVTDFALGVDSGWSYRGGVATFFGPFSGRFTELDGDHILIGESSNSAAGFTMASAGDADGDGDEDLLVGAMGLGRGGAYVVPGGFAEGTHLLADSPVKIRGDGTVSQLGTHLGPAGDLDGDGRTDIAIAEGFFTRNDILLFAGLPPSGTLGPADALSRGTATDDPDESYHYLASPGDVTGDGLDDVLAGSNLYEDASGSIGRLYLIPGFGE